MGGEEESCEGVTMARLERRECMEYMTLYLLRCKGHT